MTVIVSISGNLTVPSKTRVLANFIGNEVGARVGGSHLGFDILDAQPTLGGTVWRNTASGRLAEMLTAVEQCDVLIVGSPVYKGSFTGMLKHFFDLLDMDALRSRPVITFATGKSPTHGSKVEQHFRDLFAFFEARVACNFIYALDRDFEDGLPTNELLSLIGREIDKAVKLSANNA